VTFLVDESRMQKNNGHQKKMTAMTDRIPKKKSQNSVKFTLGNPRSDKPTKLCAYCKKYGGAHNAQNMYECKMGSTWKSQDKFKSKARSHSETRSGVNKSYALLYAENKPLTANKKSKKALKKTHNIKKKHKYKSDSDSSYDSDSS
jgi:hypothetical protein